MRTRTIEIDYRRKDPKTGEINTMQEEAFKDVKTFILMVEGGVGSGKTYEGCMKALKLSMLNQEVDGGILVPSYAMFKRDVHPCFQEIQSDNHFEMSFNGQDHYYRFPWSKRALWVLSADTAFPGVNLGWGIVNEHSQIPQEKMHEFVNRRVRKKCQYPQIEMDGTPDDKYGYLEEFTKRWEAREKFRLITGSTKLNLHNLRDDFYDDMKETLDPLAFQLWAEGKRVGAVQDAFYYSYDPTRNCDRLERNKTLPVWVGVDFNVGNMHAVLGHIWGYGKEKYCSWFDEIVLKERDADTYKLALALKAWNGGKVDGLTLIIDPAGTGRRTTGPSDSQVLENEGFDVRFKSVHPRMRDRQIRANGLFYHRRMTVDKDKCPYLHRDLLNCQQHRITLEKVKDVKGIYTHATDGMDYVLDWEFPDLDLEGRSKFRQGKIYGKL